MSSDHPLLSIVTPAYNRGPLLKNCFDSLRAQTDLDFEWIVVDDGSTDTTAEILQGFLENKPEFPVQLVCKENGGKHTALNASHPYIHGEYVLILDSDDTLTPDAVAQVRSGVESYMSLPQVGMVTFLKGSSQNDPKCYAQDEGVPVDIMRYRRTCVHSSDCCEVIPKELFLKYPFPEFPGERFLSEGALWNRISFTHKCVYVNRVIYLCEYLEGGLSKSGKPLRIRNPYGGMYTSNLNMNRKNFLVRRIKNGLLYTCYGCFAGLTPLQMAKKCDSKALMWLCLPFGWLLKGYWKRKYMK